MGYPFKLIIGIFMVAFLGWASGAWFTLALKKNMATTFAKLDEIIDSTTKYDIVYYGDSRIQSGINPCILDSLTGKHSYNAGVGGAQYDEIFLLNKLYLAHHPAPEHVILAFDESKIFSGQILLPYRTEYLFYAKDSIVKRSLEENGFHGKLARYIPFTNFAFQDDYLRTMIFHPPTYLSTLNTSICRGFINPHNETRVGPLKTKDIINDQTPIPAAKPQALLSLLMQTIALYNTLHTRVTLVIPPLHPSAQRDTIQLNTLITFLKNNSNVSIVNMQNMPEMPDEYFTDHFHLNVPGTKLFTQKIADWLIRNP